MIVDPCDLQAAMDFLRREVAAVETPDWATLAQRLTRLGSWEFEDHRP